MATMDITPQELRDIEIREAWRGYHRDDVDELLERAAATIEHLESEIAQLRAGAGGRAAAAPARTAAPVVAAAPVAPPPVAPPPVVAPPPAMPPVRTADTDVIQRTLVLAQKAADEAVAEARAKASQIVSDSEARAQKLVADAEASARRIADTEKGRLEEDIARLMQTRDTLTADVDELERFEQEYRERLRRAIHAELELLESTSAASSRPALHDVEVPASRHLPAPSVDSGPSWSASQEGVVAPPVPAPTDATQAGPSTVHIEAVPAYAAAEEPAWDPAPAGGWADAPTAALVDDSNEMALPADDYGDADSLDDDAFFASLREAVRDDAPLGPGADDDTAYFDQDDTDEHRRLFKRRR
jgi:DivIVA domain-containing protein